MNNLIFHVYILIIVINGCFSNKPNIVLIVADDMGWDDVSLHGSDAIPTPNIDALAYDGVALHRHYTYSTCTPTRSSLLSGMYSYKLGLQGYPIKSGENRAMPLDVKLMPEYLKDAGYATHLVGKWHLGASRQQYLPFNRGFDSHFGFRWGYTDYYEYYIESSDYFNRSTAGLDMFRDLTPLWDQKGYLTEVLTDEAITVVENHNKTEPLFLLLAHSAPHSQGQDAFLQAPEESIRENRHIALRSRRIFAAMVSELDKSIGQLVQKLKDENMLDNTIITFIADNGGVPRGDLLNWGSNYPMRGQKFIHLDGGIRTTGILWSPKHLQTKFWDGFMHVSDWMPTLFAAAGVEIPENLDGVNQLENISNNKPGRDELIVELDDYDDYYAIISGGYKLLIGNISADYTHQYGEEFRELRLPAPDYEEQLRNSVVFKLLKDIGREIDLENAKGLRQKLAIQCEIQSTYTCTPNGEKVCLYNIVEDPCELTDIANDNEDLVAELKARFDEEKPFVIPRSKAASLLDEEADPRYHNYVWDTWLPNV